MLKVASGLAEGCKIPKDVLDYRGGPRQPARMVIAAGLTATNAMIVVFLCNVRFGSKADIGLPPIDVRFTPESGHR